MPPVAQPQTEPETPDVDEVEDDDAAAAAWAALVEDVTAGDSSSARQIRRAIELEADRAKLMRQISDNRDYLRLMQKNEELDEDAVEFVETFYPEKERGTRRAKDEIEATRRARLAARTNGDN